MEDPAAPLAIDVSEQPIERPVKDQLVICALTLTILAGLMSKGRRYDFSVVKDSRLLLHPDARLLADSGYQGLHTYHKNSTPAH